MNNKPLTVRKSKIRILDTFWGALFIILASTLPYFHDIITNTAGLKSWVPVVGIEQFLTDSNNFILGFSTYRVFLYTFLIFVFATIGWFGWYKNAKTKFYANALLLVLLSSTYQLGIIILNLRRTDWNDTSLKLLFLGILFIVLNYFSFKNTKLTLRKIVFCLLFFGLSLLPFFHDLLTNIDGTLKSWTPNLGIEKMLTDENGYVRGLISYRVLVYMFCIHLFAHLGWFGWFMSSQGKKYRPFLLVPVALSLFQVIIIAMSWNETEFNSPSSKLYITLALSLLLAINFYFNNHKVSLKNKINLTRKTIKHCKHEN
jgi:hypothetical protein